MSDVKPMSDDTLALFSIYISITRHHPDDRPFTINFGDLRRIKATIDAKDAEIAKLRKQVETLRGVLSQVRACRDDELSGWKIGGHPGLTQLIPVIDAALKSTESKVTT